MASFLMMWLLSSTLTMVAAHDGSTIITFLGQECDEAVTPWVYVKGGQPGEKVKDLAQCVKLCEASSDCESVTFYDREAWTDTNKKTHAAKKWCKHFYTACGSLKTSSGATTVTHLANMASFWSLASIGFGRKCQGTALSSSGKQDSVAKCMTACDSEPDCKSVTFFLAEKKCEHFSTKCENSPTNDKKEDIVSMARRTDQRGALQSKCDDGKDANGSPREKPLKFLKVADLAACEKSCNDEAKCQSITFRKDWANTNCIHFETKCLYRQPQSMAIAKSLKVDMPTSGKTAIYLIDRQKTQFCGSPNAVCAYTYTCKPGFTINAGQTKCSANKCSCPNGSPKTGAACTKNGAAMCASCKAGFFNNKDQTKCSANVCSCPNGSPKTGTACTKHGAAMCESCKHGFTTNKDKTKCSDKWAGFCSSPNAVCTCKPGFTINADQNKCSANKCSCPNGSPKTGAACTKNGAAMCASCKAGFFNNKDQTKCSANVCSCPNGSPKTGAACTKNGAAMCASCKTEFTTNKDKTKCIWVSSIWTKGTKGESCQKFCTSVTRHCDSFLIKQATLDSSCSTLRKMFPGKKCGRCSPDDSTLAYCFPGLPEGSGYVYYHTTFDASKGFTCDTVPEERVTPACPCATSVCSCPNGSPKTGTACTKNGAVMCESCNAGYIIKAGQTKCSVPPPSVISSSTHAINMVVTQDGSLWVAGWNWQGQFGNDRPTRAQTTFKLILTVSAVKTVSSGFVNTMVIKQDGTLWGTGMNEQGQLGDGAYYREIEKFKQIMAGVKAVSAGNYYTMVVDQKGALLATGKNDKGQLGDGTNNKRNKFKEVLTEVEAVSTGEHHAMALKKGGILYATGYNAYGQLGDGTTTSRNTFKQVLTEVKTVSAGGSHTMVIKLDGTLWATGYNDDGAFGDGTFTGSHKFKQVLKGKGPFKAVSAGNSHTMALKTDGTLLATGYNYYGQLGDGSTSGIASGKYRKTFIAVMTGVKSVSAGGSHTMVLKADGTLWTTGDNHAGQLADGTKKDRDTFKQVTIGS